MRQTKIFAASSMEIKESGDEGIVTAYASVFNNVDSGTDRVLPGAFAKSLTKRLANIIYLPSHDYSAHISQIPAVPVSIEEDAKGLRTVSKFLLQTQAGRDSFEVLKAYQAAGKPLGLSFTYDVLDAAYVKEGNKTIRNLKEVELYEYGHCPLPMNEQARTVSVKHGDKTATSKTTIAAAFASQAYEALTDLVSDWLGDDSIVPVDFAKLHSVIGDSIAAMLASVEKSGLGDMEVELDSWGWYSRIPDANKALEEIKAGRVMSQARLNDFHSAMTGLMKVHTSTCDMGGECPISSEDEDDESMSRKQLAEGTDESGGYVADHSDSIDHAHIHGDLVHSHAHAHEEGKSLHDHEHASMKPVESKTDPATEPEAKTDPAADENSEEAKSRREIDRLLAGIHV